MFYFKESSVDMRGLNLDELIKIRDFKQEIEQLGAYHWSYRNKEEFGSYLRLHLTRQADNWGKSWGATTTAAASEKNNIQQSDSAIVTTPTEDDGFIDLIDEAVDCFEALTGSMSRIETMTNVLGGQMTERTAELHAVPQNTVQYNIKKVKRICTQAALELERYGKLMEAEVPLFKTNFSKGVSSYANATALYFDLTSEEQDGDNSLEEARDVLASIMSALTEAIPSMMEFRNVMANFPKITTRYNRAKRRVVDILDSFLSDLNASVPQLEEAEKTIEQLIGKAELG